MVTHNIKTSRDLAAWLAAWPEGEWVQTIQVYGAGNDIYDYYMQTVVETMDCERLDGICREWLRTPDAYGCLAGLVQENLQYGIVEERAIPFTIDHFYQNASDAFCQAHGFRVAECVSESQVEHAWDTDVPRRYVYDTDGSEFHDACKAKACQLLHAMDRMDEKLADTVAGLLQTHIPYSDAADMDPAITLWLRMWMDGMDAHDAALAAGVELLGSQFDNS